MTGDTIINGVDIYTTYRAFVSYEGYRQLIEWPSAKPIEYNDWQEQDGVEADLSELHLASHEATINFGVKLGAMEMRAFYAFLCSSPQLSCNFASIGLSCTLRVTGMSSLDYAFKFSTIAVNVVNDGSPFDGYTYAAPSVSRPYHVEGFKLDGVRFSDYGVVPLYGTFNKALLRPNVKPLLVRNLSTIDGAEYDLNPLLWVNEEWTRSSTHGEVKSQARILELDFGMSSASLTEFWRNYKALLYDLVKQNEDADSALDKCLRTVTIEESMESMRGCYYSQSVNDFAIWSDSHVMCNFTLSFFCTSGVSEELIRFLATEDNRWTITEDGYYIQV